MTTTVEQPTRTQDETAEEPRDIVVTWPQQRPLRSYLDELERADRAGLKINYRVSRLPKQTPHRCYMVHDGEVRGYNIVLFQCWREDRKVERVEGGFWPAGFYIVRHPRWHPCHGHSMQGFQGWRYFDRSLVQCP